MKVLLAINTLSTGGAEVFTAALARTLQRQGCEVVVFLYAGILDAKGAALAEALQSVGVSIVTPNARTPQTKVLAVLTLARLIALFRPDIIHSHLEQSDFMVALATRLQIRRRFKLVRTLHSIYAIKSLPPMLHRWLVQIFDAHVACGETVLRQYPHMGDTAYRIDNGIELFSLPENARSSLRASLNISEQARVLINVGSFDRRNGTLPKAQDVIVAALANLQRNDVIACFVGDGEERAHIEAQAHALGVYEFTRFVGRVTDVPAYLAMGDIVLMPSRFEGLPMGAIEAACAGMPLMVSDIPQFRPFSQVAVSVAVDNATALAEAINAALPQLTEMQVRAQQFSRECSVRFSIETTAQRYLELYRDLIANKHVVHDLKAR